MKNNYKLLIVILSVLLFLIIYHFFLFKSEGFTAESIEIYNNFMAEQYKKNNPIGLSLIASHTQGALGDSADKYLTPIDAPTKYPLNSKPSGIYAMIDKCEKQKVADCSAFDDPSFVTNCGLCLDIGTNSNKESATGGLVLLEEDRLYAQKNHKGNGPVNYVPTIGSCPAGKMVATKDECLRLETKIKCEKNANYDIKNCSQCYSDTLYTMVDTDPKTGVSAGSGTLYIIGNGILTYSETGYSTKSGITLSKTNPLVIALEGPEGTRISLSVTAAPGGPKPTIGGYISGKTQTGRFTMDLIQLVLTDSITGRRPRESDSTTIRGVDISIMAPGFGQSNMALVVVIPFTFVDPSSYEASKCADSPFVTTQAGAEFLQSDPCYKKGSGPGKFTAECLQGIFLSNGCLQAGKGFPSNPDAIAKLMTKPNGSYRTINEISDYVYQSAISSSTGVSASGKNLSIQEWSNTSVFCTGNEITSPCDIPEKNTGPLTSDCIIYLWKNNGSIPLKSGKANPAGPTYNIVSMAKSLFNNNSNKPNSRFCQATGTKSPINENGQVNPAVMEFWKSQGGIDKVKSIMNNIHTMANQPGLTDAQRSTYIDQCYGSIKLADRPIAPIPVAPPAPAPVAVAAPVAVVAPVFKCNGASLPTTVTPIQGNIIGKITVTSDYSLSFYITPKGVVNNTYSNILHFSTGAECCDLGTRSPGIWFDPANLNLNVRISDVPGQPIIAWDQTPGCSLGERTYVKLECMGSSIRLTIGTTVRNLTQGGKRYAGPLNVYSGHPYWPPANCLIENLCYVPVVPVYKCLTLPTTLTPRQGTVVGNIIATEDYVLSFSLTLRGTVDNWGSVLHFTKGPNCCENGDRVPGIWFGPHHSLELFVSVGDASDGNWGAVLFNKPGCVMNTKTNIKLECIGKNVTLTIGQNVTKVIQPSRRYSGPAQVYCADPWHSPANCLIEDLCYSPR